MRAQQEQQARRRKKDNFLVILQLLRVEAVERQVLYKLLTTARGQKMSKRLASSICGSLTRTKQLLKCPQVVSAGIQFLHVKTPESSAFVDLEMEGVHAETRGIPRALRLEAIRMWLLERRVAEEPRILHVEVRRVSLFFLDQLTQCAMAVEQLQFTSLFYQKYDRLLTLLQKHMATFPSEKPIILLSLSEMNRSNNISESAPAEDFDDSQFKSESDNDSSDEEIEDEDE